MTTRELRARLEAVWQGIDREAEAHGDSHSAVFGLTAFYIALEDAERSDAEDVLIEWAQSDNPKKRFDALVLIDEFGIAKAVPVLRQLADEAETSDEPSGPYEWAKLNRIIGRLTAQHPPDPPI